MYDAEMIVVTMSSVEHHCKSMSEARGNRHGSALGRVVIYIQSTHLTRHREAHTRVRDGCEIEDHRWPRRVAKATSSEIA